MTTRRARVLPQLVLTTLVAAAPLSLAACDDGDADDGGTLRVTIYGEPFIEEGIPAEEMVDGWAVTFDSFEVVVSQVDADGTRIDGDSAWELAMNTDGAGQVYGSAELSAGSVEYLGYTLGDVHVVGSAVKDGQTISFDWSIPGDTRYSSCETGQDLSPDAEATSQITVHADHLFYDDLVSEEPNVAFQIIADADTDADGIVTQAELESVDITGEDRYQVGDADISDLWAYITAQSATLGHIDGEGHCDAMVEG